MMALSEIIRFILPSSATLGFVKLREYISLYGGVRDQYYGHMVAPANAVLPFKKDEVCWVIRLFLITSLVLYKTPKFR
jgi:hypothetical protein